MLIQRLNLVFQRAIYTCSTTTLESYKTISNIQKLGQNRNRTSPQDFPQLHLKSGRRNT